MASNYSNSAYGDDRRRGSYDSFRPSEDKNKGRARDLDQDRGAPDGARERGRDGGPDKGVARRSSGDGRNLEFRDRNREADERSKDSHSGASSLHRPRGGGPSSGNRPATLPARPQAPAQAGPNRKSSIAPPLKKTPFPLGDELIRNTPGQYPEFRDQVPRTKDPQNQDLFEIYYKYHDAETKLNIKRGEIEMLEREMARRAKDADSFAKRPNAASDFPSVFEIQKRMKTRDDADLANLKSELYRFTRYHNDHLEVLVAALNKMSQAQGQAPAESAADTVPSQVLATMEAKFADLEKRLSEDRNEIAQLVAARKKSNDDVALAGSRCSALENKLQNLVTENLKLKSENDELKKDVNAVQTKVHELDASASEFGSKLDSNLTNIAELRSKSASSSDVVDIAQKVSGFHDQLRREIDHFGGLTETHEQRWKSLSSDVKSIQAMVDYTKDQLVAFGEKLDVLDFDGLDEMCGKWVSGNVSDTVRRHNELLKNLEKNLHRLEESQQPGSISDQHYPTSAEISRSEFAQLRDAMNERAANLQQFRDDFVKRLAQVQEAANKVAQETGDMCGEMIDEADSRIKKLEENALLRRSPSMPALTPLLEARISSLENQARVSHNQADPNLENRLKAIEGQNLLGALNTVIGNSNQIAARLQSMDMELKGRLDGNDNAITVISDLYNNLNTKPLADMIVMQLETVGGRYSQRIGDLEVRTKNVEGSLKHVQEHINNLHAMLGKMQQKRPASPSNVQHPEAASNKRARLDLDGERRPIQPPPVNGTIN